MAFQNHMDLVYIITINICLGIILFTIFLTSLLNKNYRLPFLTSYLYFQIFLAIFGTYGILVPGIIRKIFFNQEIPLDKIESISHFFTFLGIPFLILAWFMFLRLCHELVERRVSPYFMMSYFLVCFLFFIGYGIVIYWLKEVDQNHIGQVSRIIRYAIGGLALAVLIAGVSCLYFHLNHLKERKKRMVVILFGHMNLLIYLSVIVLLVILDKHKYLPVVFLLLFFASPLFPLLSIRTYIVRNIQVPVSHLDLIEDKEQFFNVYEISKREEEIIMQICEGKSNKEISDTLFITLQTVKDHIHRIFQKTGVKNRVQLTNLIRGFNKRQ